MKFVLANITKDVQHSFTTLGILYRYIYNALGETDINVNQAASNIISSGSHTFKTAVCEYRIDLILEPSDRIAFFIDGPDGVGKTHAIENLQFSVDVEYGHLCEFGADPLCPGLEHTAKSITLKCMEDHANPMRDAMLAFADRYKNMRYYTDDSYKFFIVDRSWLSTVVYQGKGDVNTRATIHTLGVMYTERLMEMGILPVVILLRNKPYVNKSDDALDEIGRESASTYVKASIMANDDGCLMMQSTSDNVNAVINRVLNKHTSIFHTEFIESIEDRTFVKTLATYLS